MCLLADARKSPDLSRVGERCTATSVASSSERLDHMNDHKMMTVKEVADYLQIATSTAYRLTERRELPALKVGGGWRFDIRMIDKWRFKMQQRRWPMTEKESETEDPAVHTSFR